ncbi:hypothetical protein [Streptomyces erythrochromogenes]|uniref:hypothetical protein n=1 Tax=Streptomyces erythrochromogenes TaxID=285574 RepID=UPI0036FE4C31
MKRTTLRAAGVSAVAAIAIGIAAPAASATTAAPVRAVAVVQTAEAPAGWVNGAGQVPAGVPTGGSAADQGAESSKGKAFIELLKRTGGLFTKAVAKAKEGHSAFRTWMGNQNYAVKAAWWLLSGVTQAWVIDTLASYL